MKTIEITTLGNAMNNTTPSETPLTRFLLVTYWVLLALCAIGTAAVLVIGIGVLSKIVWFLLLRGWNAF